MPLDWIHNLCKRLSGIRAGEPAGAPLGCRHDLGAPAPRSDAGVCQVSRQASFSFLPWAGTALALLLLLVPPSPAFPSGDGDQIINSAWFSSNESPAILSSVTATVLARTPSRLEFHRWTAAGTEGAEQVTVKPTEYRLAADIESSFKPLAPPVPPGATSPIDLSQPVTLLPANRYQVGETIFLRLSDSDQNSDPTVVERIVLTINADTTGDREVLRLYETSADSGVFTGYVPSSALTGHDYDGTLAVADGCRLTARYVDKEDGADISATAALVDPYGIVFDSLTGQPVNGAAVTLLNADTGREATVLGADGISAYPATVTSGGSAIDGSGRIYNFPAGGYRFPFIVPGRYLLRVAPPAGYAVPSQVSTAQLQALPGAPFSIVAGSRGDIFLINPGPAVRIDIPTDPVPTGLWVQKESGKTEASPGDLVPYRIRVENFDLTETAPGVTVQDRLPFGFRYRRGSTRIDDVPAADPDISTDGRTLTFSLGDLAPRQTVQIRYVAEIGAAARIGDAVNLAFAADSSGAVSNTARATVKVREELLRSHSILAGRVMAGSCSEADTEKAGLAGARIFLEDGTYVITDEEGKYHFEGVTPGTHVVQLDLETLPKSYEVVPCEQSARFAGRAFSQFVDLQGGTLWRADFHVGLRPKPRGEVGIELNAALEGETALLRVPVRVGAVPQRNLRLSITLPEGAKYLSGSSSLDGSPLADPAESGGLLTYPLGDGPAGRESELTLRCRLGDLPVGESSARAVLTFDTPEGKDQRTPEAENLLRREVTASRESLPAFTVRPHFPTLGADLSPEDKAELDRLAARIRELNVIGSCKLQAVGHTDNVRIAPHNRHLYADNFALSEARVRSVARYLGEALGLPPERIGLVGMGETAPIADNANEMGRALNRRVEVRLECEKTSARESISLTKDHSGPSMAATVGLRPGEAWPEKENGGSPLPEENQDGILSPTDGSSLASRILAVRVRLDSKLKVRLLLDGREIPADRIGFRLEDKKTGKSHYSFIGVDFGAPGTHTLELQGIDPFGNARFKRQATVIRTGEIASIRVLESAGNIADGLTPVRLRIELLDAAGKPIRASAALELRSGDLKPLAEQKERIVETVASGAPLVQIDADGYARFEPVQQSGPRRVVLGYNKAEVTTEFYVQPQLRDWILVGLAEGTAGYNMISGRAENLNEFDVEEGYYDEGRLAFYAKGKVKGKWLLTLAYDSDKPDLDGKSLHQTIDPDRFYTVYGDASEQKYDASSARKLYVKLERDQFYALFGDYETGLTVTELSRYNRSLNGLKAELDTGRFALNVFASDSGQVFVKDEIRGDGTSGLYRLSRPDIVLNSEKIVIETRDRFRSEVVLEARPLVRHIDYDIDYDAGTLFFKEPVPSRSEGFNPIYIVVDYEADGTGEDFLNYGGRGAIRLFDRKLELGASLIREEQGLGEGDLLGGDATLKLGEHTRLRAEMAQTQTRLAGEEKDGTAYLAELEHRSGRLSGTAYFREQGAGFGLGQQRGSEDGTRKYGLEGIWQLTDHIALGGEGYRQENLLTDGTRSVLAAETRYEKNPYRMRLGLRRVEDELGDTSRQSVQAFAGGAWTTMNGRLTLHGDHEQALQGKDESADFPTRTLLGADYRLTEKVTFLAAQEFTQGSEGDTASTRLGFKTLPWRGGQLNTGLEQQRYENGSRVFANLGLTQSWQLTERWQLDGSLDRSQSVRTEGAPPLNVNVPPASGSRDDFTAVSLGAAYKDQSWTWNGRVEWRTSNQDDKWTVASGLMVEPQPGIALSNRIRLHKTDVKLGDDTTEGEVRFGLAWRPVKGRWIFLDRLDLRFKEQEGDDLGFDEWRIVNNLNANWKINRRAQLALQYGAKYVMEETEGERFSGYTDLIGVEGRFDLTERWDIGLRTSLLHSWNDSQIQGSSGISLGCNLVKNAWVSLGYNFLGFQDADFSRADFTAQGPFLRFRFKFDQNSVREALNGLN